MKLEGTLFRANLTIADVIVERQDCGESFVKQLESCFVQLCRELEIPIPLWLDKNTKEFSRFHQTLFFEEQFTDKVLFNRFQIKLLN